MTERDTMVEWDVPMAEMDPQELERMEEEAVRNVVDKIGERARSFFVAV